MLEGVSELVPKGSCVKDSVPRLVLLRGVANSNDDA